jgi:predicted dienelactone hydrolase
MSKSLPAVDASRGPVSLPLSSDHLSRRSLLAWLALSALPLQADEPPPYRVLDLDWRDPARERAVPVRLYLPGAATPAHPVPLVVFSHGIGGSRNGYRYLGSHWASQGWASLHLQHVGSDRQLWFGNVFGVIGRLRDAAQDGEAIARVQDLSFALDQLLAQDLAPLVDARRIVAAGHSYGANTTLLASGARVSRNGRSVDLHDERIRAAIVISAPPFYGESTLDTILGPVQVPSLHVTATEDVIRIPGYYSGAEDRVAVFDAVGSPRKALAVFEGGSHSMFTDRGGTGGVVLNPQVKTATRELSLAFLQTVFDGDNAALRAWPGRHREILARFALTGLA